MNVLHTIRSTLISAFVSLPILLIGFIGLLAIGLGNLGLFVLFIGQTTVVPLAVALVQLLTKRFGGDADPRFFVRASDLGRLVPSATSVDYMQNVAPSYWLTHIWFFLTYLFTNAAKVRALHKDPKASPALYANRRMRATSLMAVAGISVGVLTALRFFMGTETMAGVVISALVGGLLGWGWYEFAAFCGARHADIFGIAQQILSADARKAAPMTCVYTARP
jgi:hypothetical protein